VSEEIGFIGLGAMGLPMATNLIAAGHKLRVYNRTPAKAQPLVERGAAQVARPGDTARPGGIVITMVSDDEVLKSVVLGPDSIASRLAPGGVHISMSTVAPATSRELARHHADCGSSYVGAPVFGRPDNAAAAQLVVCVSGPSTAKTRVRPLFEPMGRAIFDFGEDPGAANVAKLAGNFLISAALEAIAEALAMVEKSGVERTKVAEMLGKTLFKCPIYQHWGQLVAEKRHTSVVLRMGLGLKDLNLVLSTAGEVKVPMPVASLVRDRLLAGLAKGREQMDWSAFALGVLDEAGLQH
jgi:3-hydroxyisobutyrate dehydrogenase-like beta-hydroxyacid dehydrogenase